MAASWLRYIWLCWYWAAIRGCGTRGERGVGVGGELEQSVLAPVELREVLGPWTSSDPLEAIMWARIWSRGRKAAILISLSEYFHFYYFIVKEMFSVGLPKINWC